MPILSKVRFLFALVLIPLAGCAINNLTADNPVHMPDVVFLTPDTIGPIEKAEFSPATWVYRHPERSPLDFAQVIVSNVRIYDNMSTEIKKRDRRKLDEVGTSFQKRITRLIEKDYLPVTEPNPLALRIDIELFQLKPGVRIFKDRKERIKLDSNVAGTKVEASCYDSVTGELIFAVSTFYEGTEYAAYENPVLIKNLRGAFGEWSEHFKQRFDQVMSFSS